VADATHQRHHALVALEQLGAQVGRALADGERCDRLREQLAHADPLAGVVHHDPELGQRGLQQRDVGHADDFLAVADHCRRYDHEPLARVEEGEVAHERLRDPRHRDEEAPVAGLVAEPVEELLHAQGVARPREAQAHAQAVVHLMSGREQGSWVCQGRLGHGITVTASP